MSAPATAVVLAWESTVGPLIANMTVVEELQDGVLWIALAPWVTAASDWLAELDRLAPRIVSALSRVGVENVRWIGTAPGLVP